LRQSWYKVAVDTQWNFLKTNYAITVKQEVNWKKSYYVVSNWKIKESKKYESVHNTYISNDWICISTISKNWGEKFILVNWNEFWPYYDIDKKMYYKNHIAYNWYILWEEVENEYLNEDGVTKKYFFSFDWKDIFLETDKWESYELYSVNNSWFTIRNDMDDLQCDIIHSPKWVVIAKFTRLTSTWESKEDIIDIFSKWDELKDNERCKLRIKMNYNDKDWIKECYDNKDGRLNIWGKKYIKQLLFPNN
jgi:hypothetical protein